MSNSLMKRPEWDREKEAEDIGRIAPVKSRLWLIPVTVVATLAIVFGGLFVGGFFSSRTVPAGPPPPENTASAPSAECVSAVDAKNHVGKQVTVCGKVESSTYAQRTKGKPTFLNLDKAYPNQIFTIVIWDTDRSKFGSPEIDFRGKNIKVTGKVELYKKLPEIIVNNPSQIVIQ